jgi:saccharopine dehydrogenase-like NADP-dependent oxidoreductase
MRIRAAGNYQTLIVAGLGAVGSSLLKLGGHELRRFQKIILVDLQEQILGPYQERGYRCLRGSVEDYAFLRRLVTEVETSGLFLNLCSNTDNVRVRKFLAPFNLAYLDSCASVTPDPDEHRFSRMMAYTRTAVESRYPHWLCWGVNPGLVEIVTRKLIREFAGPETEVEVAVFEYDRLRAEKMGKQLAVGWCPRALLEEIMLAPALVVRDGVPTEESRGGARRAVSFWQGQAVDAWLAAHEDIWNMAMIKGVREASFLYSFNRQVMEVLEGETGAAEALLRIPPADSPISGLEQVAVQVKKSATGEERTLFWETDHHEVWRRLGVNGVQYQTAKSLLFALKLLQETEYGTRPGNYCASDLPIGAGDWPVIDNLFKELGIEWRDGSHLELSFGRRPLNPAALQADGI